MSQCSFSLFISTPFPPWAKWANIAGRNIFCGCWVQSVCGKNYTFNFRVSVLKTVCCFFLALRAVSQFHHGRALTPKCTFLLLQASIIVRPDQFRSNFIHLQVKKYASNIGLPQKDKTKLSSGNIKRGNLMTPLFQPRSWLLSAVVTRSGMKEKQKRLPAVRVFQLCL